MTDDDFVRFFQSRALAAGHYTGKVDGIAGPGTLAALDKALPKLVQISPPPTEVNTKPAESLPKLDGVHNALVALVRLAAISSPVPFTVVEGVRSKARQEQLVKAGASKTMNSRHLTGHAVDLWPLDKNGKPLPSDAAFKRGSKEAKAADAALWSGLRAIAAVMKDAAKQQGTMIEWGGDWGWDAPHFQLNRQAFPS